MKLVIATQNQGKVREVKRILEPLGITAVSCGELGIHTDVAETGSTFAENAQIKARTMMALCGLPTVADDSGLCVDALGGAPGIYSARYAGEGASDAYRVEKLLEALRGIPPEQRTAHFVSAICCVFPGGGELCVQGECEGVIGEMPRGENGFGYDPIFETAHGSFSELSAAQKDAVSHRGKALRALCVQLQDYLREHPQTTEAE